MPASLGFMEGESFFDPLWSCRQLICLPLGMRYGAAFKCFFSGQDFPLEGFPWNKQKCKKP